MPSKNGQVLLREKVTVQDLASMFLISERQVQRLSAQGILKLARNSKRQTIRGRYVLGDAVSQYVKYLRESLGGDPNEGLYLSARAKRMQCMAAQAEIELAAKKGEYFRRDDLEFGLGLLLRNARDRLLGVPSRVMHNLLGLTKPADANRIVDDAIRLALTDVSNFKLSDFKKETDSYLRSIGVPPEITDGKDGERPDGTEPD